MFELGRREQRDDAAPRSILGLEGSGDRERPKSRSLLGLEPESSRGAPEDETPIFDLERKTERAFPIERAVLFSLAAHVVFLLILLAMPQSISPDAKKGLLAALMPQDRTEEEKIPVIFHEGPGPARENPKKSALSDLTRRAGGGDPSRPKSQSPFIPPQPGREGLAPGSVAASPPSRGTSSQGKERKPESAFSAPGQKEARRPDSLLAPPPGPGSTGGRVGRLAGLDRAIQEAAKGIEREGEGGAGLPNPEGGFVDSGPISFDTTWYDWGPYAEEMVRRIKLHWEIPELARLGWKGKLTIRFIILADGRVEGATIVRRSGVPPFDFAALQAILKSNPFRPLPKDLLAQVPGKDREGITVTFFYNIRPGKEDQEAGTR